jgi:hypothetical protein
LTVIIYICIKLDKKLTWTSCGQVASLISCHLTTNAGAKLPDTMGIGDINASHGSEQLKLDFGGKIHS